MTKRLQTIDAGIGTVATYANDAAAEANTAPLATFRIVATPTEGQDQVDALLTVMAATADDADPAAQEELVRAWLDPLNAATAAARLADPSDVQTKMIVAALSALVDALNEVRGALPTPLAAISVQDVYAVATNASTSVTTPVLLGGAVKVGP